MTCTVEPTLAVSTPLPKYTTPFHHLLPSERCSCCYKCCRHFLLFNHNVLDDWQLKRFSQGTEPADSNSLYLALSSTTILHRFRQFTITLDQDFSVSP